MKDYQKEILNRLLDKYEGSKSFIGENKVKQTFSVNLMKEFPEYGDDARVREIAAIHEAAEVLSQKGFVTIKKEKFYTIRTLTLCPERLEEIYRSLKRRPKRDTGEELRQLLVSYSGGHELPAAYCQKQLDRLAANKSVEFFHGDVSELADVLKAATAALSVQQEVYQRDFSIRLFGDSKRFEKLRGTVTSLLYEYGDFPEKDKVLEELNIIKNPGHVYFKGAGAITLAGQPLDLGRLEGDIAVSSAMLRQIDSIRVYGKRVVTVENLTTFNAYCPEDEFVLYLGGFMNTARLSFIREVYRRNPDKDYCHYGDIDAGGFYILLHLRKKTGIDFRPLHMDVRTLEENLAMTKKLTDNDRKRLTRLQDTEFAPCVAYMLEHNCKLEQEALD